MNPIKKNKHLAVILCMVSLSSTLGSCRKYLEIDLPKDQITSTAVFDNAANTLAAVNGLYTYALKPANFLTYQGDFLLGITADEFQYSLNYYDEFMTNSIAPASYNLGGIWSLFYQVIYQANGIIEKVPGSPVADNLKATYIAEAKIFRAFCHLYLTSYFGDVPLIQTTNVTVTSSAKRTAKADVLKAIATDLQDAESILAPGTIRNGRFNKWMATALLARVYLYQKDWANAETKATALIADSTDFTLVKDLNKVFLRGSKEAIWQVNTAGGANDNYTYFAGVNVPSPSTSIYTMVRPELYNAFETGDGRKAAWIGSATISGVSFNYDYKYKSISTPSSAALVEDYMLLRLAEQYLIRAEARAQQSNLSGAIDDINAIRSRAGLPGISYSTAQSDVLLAIEQERRVELFGEGYGHRWIDLNRTGRANVVMTAEKPATWKSTSTLFPIPATELANNPALSPNPSN